MKERINFHALWCSKRDAWMANGYDTKRAAAWQSFIPLKGSIPIMKKYEV
ncbi:hypothetical protein [Paenibacillus sp. Soil522]|nr:hypothetical protein [Paenibacillus sp. Soil522]